MLSIGKWGLVAYFLCLLRPSLPIWAEINDLAFSLP